MYVCESNIILVVHYHKTGEREKIKYEQERKYERKKKYFFALFVLCITTAFSFTYASRVCVYAPQTTQHHCQEVKYVCRRDRERKGMV